MKPGPVVSDLSIRSMKMGKESLSRKISFLRPGWWIVHVTGIALVYSLGNLLWR
jgi:hypothetical protein